MGNGCEIVSLVLLDEYVITRDKDTESMRYGGSSPPMTQKKRKQFSRIFTIDKIQEKGCWTFRRILIAQDVEYLRCVK